MIEEVVPFSKEQTAIIMLALQDMNLPLSQRILELVYFKVSSGRHLVLYFNFSFIEVWSLYDLNLGSSGDLFSDILIVDIVSVNYLLFLFNLLLFLGLSFFFRGFTFFCTGCGRLLNLCLSWV